MDTLPFCKKSYIFLQGDEQVIDDAFKERDPQRHCAMRGMSGKVWQMLVFCTTPHANPVYPQNFVKFMLKEIYNKKQKCGYSPNLSHITDKTGLCGTKHYTYRGEDNERNAQKSSCYKKHFFLI